MTLTHDWTINLAEAAVPAEVYLASNVADVYIANLQANDKNPKSLEDLIEEDAGAFNTCQPCDMNLLLPSILDSVIHSANHLIVLLTSDESKDLLEVTAILLPLALHKHSNAVIQNIYVNMDDEYPVAKTTIEDLAQGFESAGMYPRDATPAAFRTVLKFIEDRKSALAFLSGLQARKRS
jgi:hypothetical protein